MPEIGASTKFSFQVDGLSSTTWVARFEAREAISSLFEVSLLLTSDDKDIPFADVVGKSALLTLETDGSDPRYLHGMVARFRHADDGKKVTAYEAIVVPKLWRLKHRHDARIFQAEAVPDILQAVLSGAGVDDVRLALTGSYAPREYCVQYRESDFAFVSRLMEEEGIHYFFEHTDAKHTLVLADAPSAAAPIPSPDSIAFKATLGAMAHGESVSRFSSYEEVKTGKVSLTDYNFKKPSLSLMASSSGKLDSDLEIYDHPGTFDDSGVGDAKVKAYMEAEEATHDVVDAESTAISFRPAGKFSLAEHPAAAENKAWVVLQIQHAFSEPSSPRSGGGEAYRNSFRCMPASQSFRPLPRTPKPLIHGLQTAVVVGPSGEEIDTDEHGRIRVQFPWDREGANDDKSSCWIRVAQPWAGKSFGAFHLPRIGQEVLIAFMEGDPDRPLVVGSVYNDVQTPPFALPANKTQTGIRTRSTKDGGADNCNEFRFEDKKGEEQIFLHAEKDELHEVENDQTLTVGHDQSISVGHDCSEDISHDRTLHVGNDHSDTVDKNRSISIGEDHDETIGKSMTLSVSDDRSMSIGKSLTEDISENMSVTVGKDSSTSVSGGYSLEVGKDATISVSGKQTESITKELSISAKKIQLNGQDEISIVSGSAKIVLKKNGDISIEGKKITIKGSGDVVVKGSKVAMN